jgi:CheY-like chemotaxis protein
MSKILVIDDEALLREEIVDTLRFSGYEVIAAADGVKGVNCAVLHHPDLIVCDITMPRLDGYGVLSDVRSNSILRWTPFIFMTAKAEQKDIRAGMDRAQMTTLRSHSA